jgi:adenylate kinase
MRIILIGIQGAGKSTQGNLLRDNLKIPYLSTGHIFREMSKEKSQIGRYIKEIMNAGYLIPDNKTVEIVSEYLKKPEYKGGYILDGFPRTVEQVRKFKNGVDKVVYLKVSDKEALWRLSYRKDETLPAIRKRIELFHKLTEPVLDYYKKKRMLVEIDGEKEIKKIFKDILDKIKE